MIHIYSKGIVSCSVCAPTNMTIEEVTKEVNAKNPTGIKTDWELSEEKFFSDGNTPHPKVCEGNETRTHYLFHC